jgi:Holin of 3TMs, for gene-transfer release
MAGSPIGWAKKGNKYMALLDALISPIAGLIDKIISDPKARDAAKLELLKLQGSQELDAIKTQMTAIVAEAQSTDPWTSRARPSFLYVMYTMILWAIPMGLIAAVRPEMARGIADGMNAYLAGIPEPMWALFGTGYLGYTAARSWGKAKGVEK